jgi:hypothetical protein
MSPEPLLKYACWMTLWAAPLGCAPAPSPATPDTAATPPSSSASPASSASAPPAEAAEPPAAHRRPLELKNECTREMHVYFGEQPGDGKGQASTVAAGAVVAVPRNPDGTGVVWVTDDTGAGLASVHITKWMRHVRIDSSCTKLDADSTR